MKNYILLRNGVLVDGTGRNPIKNAGVLIEESKIIKTGEINEISLPESENIHTIDVSGKTIMPGMIESHMHLWYHLHRSIYDSDFRSPEMNTILAVKNAKTYLDSGFTSVRDTGTQGRISIAIRDAIEQGIILGPSVIACGPVITTTGGLGDHWPSWIGGMSPDAHIIINGVDEAIKAVRRVLKEGADCIKLEASGTAMSPFCPSSKLTLTYDELAAASREAHRNGKLVAIHAENTEAIKNAVKAGANTIEHGIGIDNESVKMMKENNVYLVPTLGAYLTRYEKGKELGVPDFVIERLVDIVKEHSNSFKKAYKSGVKIAFGTDSGGIHYPHGYNAKELEYYVKHGMSEMDALVSVTKNAAEAIGLGDKVGTVEEGKFADILIVDGDPLKDIKVLQNKERISNIIKNGKIIK